MPFSCTFSCGMAGEFTPFSLTMLKPFAKGAPADAMELLRWTVQSVHGYFKTLGKRQLWLTREQAEKCVQQCQQFTLSWHPTCNCLLDQKTMGHNRSGPRKATALSMHLQFERNGSFSKFKPKLHMQRDIQQLSCIES